MKRKQLMEIQPYILARSKAGHDKDRVYVIKTAEEEYVTVMDGNHSSFDAPKRKNRKHIQIIRLHIKSPKTDQEVREIIEHYNHSLSYKK